MYAVISTHKNQRDSLCFQSHQRTILSGPERPATRYLRVRKYPARSRPENYYPLRRIFGLARTANIRWPTNSCQADQHPLTATSNNAFGTPSKLAFPASFGQKKPAHQTAGPEVAGCKALTQCEPPSDLKVQNVYTTHCATRFQLRFVKLV